MNPERPASSPSEAPARPGLLTLALVAALGLAGCRPPPPSTGLPPLGPDELARVGPVVITLNDLAAERERRAAATVADAALLDRLVRRELLFAEARRTGFADTAEMQAAWKDLVARRFEESRLAAAEGAGEPGEAALAAFHAAHAGRYTAPERVHAAVIQLHRPRVAVPAQQDEAQARAEAIRTAVLAAPDAATAFAALAREHSQQPGSRRGGGDLGWLTRAGAAQFLPAEVVAALFAETEPGAVSPVILTAEGAFLVQLVARRPAAFQPLDAVRERVRHDLARARAAEAETALVAQLRAGHPVELNAARLAELARPQPPPALASGPPSLPVR